ncbi:hypothetical protein OUZ56_026445 [Daphnia magna]|uniref:Uncharacterized protein n=1 Tax=Daphnia magna TaxID=35525 RepID=A0ABQ9ZLW7_9CRUS|nr:hypothetical protein OUZ56_026445 [Daphnia magna]
MSEAVAKDESIESCGNISIEDEMKPEAVKNEGPLLPDNYLKQKRGRRKAAHTKLTNQLRKAVADHKMGAVRLKKLQRDELIRIYEDGKNLHRKYMDSLPDITDPERPACEKWEFQFDTDHVEILQFAIRRHNPYHAIKDEVYSLSADRLPRTTQPAGPALPEAET